MTTEALTEPTSSINFDSLDRGTRFMKLRAPIDEHEMTALAVEAAQAHKQIEDLEDERKSLNKDIKSRSDARDAALAAVNTGYREKDVQCEIGYDWPAGRRYTRRLDTGELVDPAGDPIDDKERQMQLDGFDAAGIMALTIPLDVTVEDANDADDEPETDEPDDDAEEGD